MNTPPRLLLVEDSLPDRQLFECLLEDFQRDCAVCVECAQAMSGSQALELLDRAHFDAVILDQHMPEMSGSEVMTALNGRFQRRGDRPKVLAYSTLAAGVEALLRQRRDGGRDSAEGLLRASETLGARSNLSQQVPRTAYGHWSRWHLVMNGLKFRPGNAPRIHVYARPDDTMWRISVRDHGIGIAPRHRQRIFRIFQRLHTAAYDGTGIGLAICEKIVTGHGVGIWVESAPGQGATFHFTLHPAERLSA